MIIFIDFEEDLSFGTLIEWILESRISLFFFTWKCLSKASITSFSSINIGKVVPLIFEGKANIAGD